MVGDDVLHGRRNANRMELSGVLLILVEKEDVSISEVLLHAVIHLVLPGCVLSHFYSKVVRRYQTSP